MRLAFLKQWYGYFSKDELKKFFIALVIFGCILAAYWALRPIKDGIFQDLVGRSSQPFAKILSLLIVFPLVIIYTKLLDIFPRHRMFYILCPIYAVGTLIFAYLFSHPALGLSNIQEFVCQGAVERQHLLPMGRLIGWAWYVFVESYGSLVVALFWGFMADITTPESARRGFPLIALGQWGTILGPLIGKMLLDFYHSTVPTIIFAACVIITIMPLIFLFMRCVPAEQMVGYQAKNHAEKKEVPGFFEGLKLVFTTPYLFSILTLITLYEAVVTVLDFRFKWLAGGLYQGSDLCSYLSSYAIWVGVISMLCVVLGVNNIQRRLGIKISLILLPLLVAAALIVFAYAPILPIAFCIMVATKAFNYALNAPTMHQLYIPTTREAKYKAKGWIDTFGGRFSKAFGSSVNIASLSVAPSLFLPLGAMLAVGSIGVWLWIAIYLATTYNKAIARNDVVC